MKKPTISPSTKTAAKSFAKSAGYLAGLVIVFRTVHKLCDMVYA